MALHPGFPVDLAGGTAIDTGLSLMGTVATYAGDGSARTGVFPRTSSQTIVSGRSDMKVDVSPFTAVLSREGQGVVFVCNDGVEQVTIPASPVSGSRIDVVWVRHKDAQVPNSDDLSELVLGVTPGIATSGTPAAPAIPDGALELGQVRVSAGAAFTNGSGVTISQTFRFTAMEGGRVLVRTPQELAAWTTHVGSEAYLLSNGRTYTRRGTAWVDLRPLSVDINDTADGNGYLTIPHSLGVEPDWVQVTPRIYNTGLDSLDLVVDFIVISKSASQVRIRMIRRDSNQWLAGSPGRGWVTMGVN